MYCSLRFRFHFLGRVFGGTVRLVFCGPVLGVILWAFLGLFRFHGIARHHFHGVLITSDLFALGQKRGGKFAGPEPRLARKLAIGRDGHKGHWVETMGLGKGLGFFQRLAGNDRHLDHGALSPPVKDQIINTVWRPPFQCGLDLGFARRFVRAGGFNFSVKDL